MKYIIEQRIIQDREIELPEGSLPVSVKHHGAYSSTMGEVPECWQVIWLEPAEEVRNYEIK